MRLLYTLALVLIYHSSYGSNPTNIAAKDSLFWKIISPDGQKESYLLGSIHVLEKRDFQLPDSALHCFNKSATLITEVDLMEKSALSHAYEKMILPKGTTIRDYVSLKELYRLDTIWRRLKFNEFEIMSFKMMKPIFWTGLVINKLLDEPHEGYDQYFSEKATQSKKPIVGLESIEFAVQQIDSIPLKEQYKSFLEEMKNMKTSKKELQTLSKTYRQRNITKLMKTITEGLMELEGGEQQLLIARNQHWWNTLDAQLKEKPCFVVVGAAHLFGNYGLLSMLQQNGYRLQAFRRSY